MVFHHFSGTDGSSTVISVLECDWILIFKMQLKPKVDRKHLCSKGILLSCPNVWFLSPGELPLLTLVFAWRGQVLLLLPRVFSGLWAQVALPPWPLCTTRSSELFLPPLWLCPSTPSWPFLLKERLPRFCHACTLHCLSGSFLSKTPADVKTHWKEMWDRGFLFLLQSQPWTSPSLSLCPSSFEERSESSSWAIEAGPCGPLTMKEGSGCSPCCHYHMASR